MTNWWTRPRLTGANFKASPGAILPAAPKGQSQSASIIEATANIATGFGVALVLTHWLFPHLSAYDNARVTTIFTVVSLIRSYLFRRAFNWITVNE